MSIERQAARFVEARRAASGFSDYPGALPADLDQAYAVQLAEIGQWPDRIAGWKVGRIAPPLVETLGEDRFVGPMFAATILSAGATNDFAAIENGFSAFEAELVIVASGDAPAGKTDWTADEAADLAGAMHIAVEVAGGPFAAANDLGPLTTIASFGGNNGLVLGAEIANWRALSFDAIRCITTIDGTVAGQAPASAIPGTPIAAFAFALARTARMGRPIRKGDLISTGAITGVHAVRIGQRCTADFGDFGAIACTVVKAAHQG
ncbi:2-keto-4-pentenoate hydratase [Sphingomonas histidinilytica]|uniref:2-keto-4-pentenoate hydratase n=1 Tax=Rhizorhabdus histidinilytica TaxID=439228 RepID=A0A1T5GI84_9SPHN|nr:fumarylacetoacetate hydrolase family protein [Rhizorhabdus histidinilytica]MBO9380591.1 2-keto-4-pentenoate hydratase [Rhizorhabdus histidinilytica]SKC08164.1 2-keto-4-pentenoate hydratase [Rhizorhabdus histidinilytica]